MSFRGSLTQCVDMMAYQFGVGNYEVLHISRNTDSHYYTLLSPVELKEAETRGHFNTAEMICSLTSNELRKFHTAKQLNLFQEGKDGDLTPPVP